MRPLHALAGCLLRLCRTVRLADAPHVCNTWDANVSIIRACMRTARAFDHWAICLSIHPTVRLFCLPAHLTARVSMRIDGRLPLMARPTGRLDTSLLLHLCQALIVLTVVSVLHCFYARSFALVVLAFSHHSSAHFVMHILKICKYAIAHACRWHILLFRRACTIRLVISFWCRHSSITGLPMLVLCLTPPSPFNLFLSRCPKCFIAAFLHRRALHSIRRPTIQGSIPRVQRPAALSLQLPARTQTHAPRGNWVPSYKWLINSSIRTVDLWS